MENERFDKIPLPRENAFLVGYEKTERDVLQTINNSKFEGSWLICGNKGIGKATLAYRIARLVLSNNKTAQTSLFVEKNSSVFKLVASNSHPDLKIVERSLTDEEAKKRAKLIIKGDNLNEDEEKDRKRKQAITVDNIREIGHFLSLTPFLGGHRIVVVDAVDELNEQASNALLKILEEPPKKAIMILICHNQGKIKPTILSRCRKIYVSLDYDKAYNVIKNFVPNIIDEDVHNALLLANGSVGLALDIIACNGIAIVKKFASIFSELPYAKPYEINVFAENITDNDENYQTARTLIPDIFSRSIKGLIKKTPRAIENIIIDNIDKQGLNIEDLLNIRNDICQTFEITDKLNLDKKVAIMNIFFKASEVIKLRC